jgi:hypothetical protein
MDMKSIALQAFDLKRMIVFSTVGAIYFAPCLHVWFNTLNKMPFPKTWSSGKKAFAMVGIDALFFSVILNAGFFFAFALVESLYPVGFKGVALGAVFARGWQACLAKLGPTLIANYYCWPFLNYVNFAYIPVQYRVLFVNFASVFWNMYYSKMANK